MSKKKQTQSAIQVHPREADEFASAEKRIKELKIKLGHLTAQQMMLAHEVIASEKELQEKLLKVAEGYGITDKKLWVYDPTITSFKIRQ